jgi:phenylpyruvate tautomerase PptA (4-oxalocrotonate tautomerase family)
MPLIEIRALPQPSTVDLERVVRRVTRDVAAALGARPDAVWVTWSTIERPYAVGDAVLPEQPPGTHAPLVHVYARRTQAQLEAVCGAIEQALAEELELEPHNVFITVQPVWTPG